MITDSNNTWWSMDLISRWQKWLIVVAFTVNDSVPSPYGFIAFLRENLTICLLYTLLYIFTVLHNKQQKTHFVHCSNADGKIRTCMYIYYTAANKVWAVYRSQNTVGWSVGLSCSIIMGTMWLKLLLKFSKHCNETWHK